MRHFELEKFFSKWEFAARYHMTASDIESMTLQTLLQMGAPEDRRKFDQLWLGYTETWGAPDLRQAIAETYEDVIAEDVLCLAGAGEGIYAVSRVLLDRDDHAIVVVPNYQSSETVPLQVCQVSGVALREEEGWKLDLDEVAAQIRPTTKMIAVNFPHNPTGAVLSAEELTGLVELCRKHGIYLLSDEVYRGVEADPVDTAPQVADLYERGLSLNVMSKAYGLPGLRVGWLACRDKELLQEIERYKHYLSICNSGPSERLSLIALKNRDLILNRNRALIAENLAVLDAFFADYPDLFQWTRPRGGAVGFVRYLGADGVENFCEQLIERKGVLLLPSSLYRSDLMVAPNSHFRIGFGRISGFKDGLAAMRSFLEASSNGR